MSLLLLFGGSSVSTSVNVSAATATATSAAPEPKIGPTLPVATATAIAPAPRPKLVDGFGLNVRSAPDTLVILWVSNLEGVQKCAVVNPDAFEQEYRLQSLETLKWRLRADDDNVALIGPDYTVTYNDDVYRVTVVEPERSGAEAWVNYEAEALWMTLADDKQIGDFVLLGVTPYAGLTSILTTNVAWTIEDPSVATTFSMSKSDASTLELLRGWAKVCGREISFDTSTMTVSMPATEGTTQGLGFRYGRNLRTVKRRQEPPKTTRLWAFGAQDLPLPDPGYVEDYSYYVNLGMTTAEARASYTKEDVWRDSTFVDQTSLAAAANARLTTNAQPIITYECSVIDLSLLTGQDENAYGIGDTIRVTDLDLGFDVTPRVVRILRRPLNPSRNEIELSTSFDISNGSGESARNSQFDQWFQFLDVNSASRTVGAAVSNVAEVDVSFVTDGRAQIHGHIYGTATGTGTLTVQVYDTANSVALGPVEQIVFANGDLIRWDQGFALEGLSGEKNIQLRAQRTSGTGTVAIDPNNGRLYVYCTGTNRELTYPETSVTYTYDGTDGYQAGSNPFSFTVPDAVTEITVIAAGAQGRGGAGGVGATITATVPVTPGEILRVIAPGGAGGSVNPINGGYPDGGDAGSGSTRLSWGGGGSARVLRTPYTITDALVIAGGGGGSTFAGSAGGAGGYPTGDDGVANDGNNANAGHGATASAGGTSGGAQGAGGDAGSYGLFGEGGGGGGGGWYGGGAGNSDGDTSLGGNNAGAGGGGSSYVNDTAGVVLVEVGEQVGSGYVTITWRDPTLT